MEYAKRKYPRLKHYDYSLPGYYYVTIHLEQGAGLLSTITQVPLPGRAEVHLTEDGRIAQEQLVSLEKRYDYVKIDKFVVMPTHIHVIIRLLEGECPRTDITAIVGAYKSLTTIAINKTQGTPGKKHFQRSFYETVLRNGKAYQECWQYIDGNPDQWTAENPETKPYGGGKSPPYID